MVSLPRRRGNPPQPEPDDPQLVALGVAQRLHQLRITLPEDDPQRERLQDTLTELGRLIALLGRGGRA